MALRDAIVDRLTSDHAGTAALIGRRCYPLVKPQGMKLTCVVYQRISQVRDEAGGSDSGLAANLMQFRCIAPSESAAQVLAVQVVSAVSKWSGTLQSETIQGTFVINVRDGEPEVGDDGKVSLYSVLIDARVWHLE